MSTSVNAILLAAGLGTRLRPLTLKYPKPCVPFLNVPMGLYQFRFLEHIQVDRLVVNTFHLPEQIEKLFKSQPYFNGPVSFSHESPIILGNGGGLKKASAQMDLTKPILMMNADEIYLTQDKTFLKRALDQHIAHKNLATLVVMKHQGAGTKFGAIWADGEKVETIMAAKTSPQNKNFRPWHYIGALFIEPEVIANIPDNKELNIFYDVIIHELPKNRVEICTLECEWFETGNPTDYLNATQQVMQKLDAELLAFISQFDSSHVIESNYSKSLISTQVKVAAENLTGFNVIARSANLNQSSKIKDSVLFDSEIINAEYFTKN
ncbi:MAG: NTP transferase domain-containing protein [Bdellovibrionaceae bacterium]|nr:NTP transferase domain-containing protein [Bdellovibrio sp.]